MSKAEAILERGLAVANVRDRASLLERLADLYEETALADKAAALRKSKVGAPTIKRTGNQRLQRTPGRGPAGAQTQGRTQRPMSLRQWKKIQALLRALKVLSAATATGSTFAGGLPSRTGGSFPHDPDPAHLRQQVGMPFDQPEELDDRERGRVSPRS